MRAAVLHLGDLRVRIVRVGPVRVRALLLAGPVEPGQLGARRRREAGRLGQPGQKRVRSSRPCPAAQCSASPHWLPASWHRCPPCAHHQRGVGQSLQHPGKHCLMGLEVNQATVRDSGRVVRRGLVEGEVQKRANAQRVGGRATRSLVPNPTLQSSRATAAENTGPAPDSPTDPVRVRTTRTVPPRTRRTRVVEHSIQPLVKRVPSTLRQIRRGHPHRRLPRSTAACPHRHARQCRTQDRSCRSLERGTFTTGC